jgi:Protein of unknown function (DUF2752)
LIKQFFLKYFELVFWISAMVSLAITNPAGPEHYSLCPLKAMGITWCPGCGLGHSISWLFHGDISNSLHAHWLGIPAAAVIFYRIHTLITQRLTDNKSFFAR